MAKTNRVRNYPKGKKHHTVPIPEELSLKLMEVAQSSCSEFVVTSETTTMMQYKSYLKTLKLYCDELELPRLGTHGLRHTTWELYRNFGGTKEDMQRLFAHSSLEVTERYLHGAGNRLEKVAGNIRLFE